jgi:hypothetical protein
VTDRLASAALMPDPRVPTRRDAVVFNTKATLLRLGRTARDTAPATSPHRHRPKDELADAPIRATIVSPLWTAPGGAKDHALTAGKVQNLRAALRGIDGVVVGAGNIFSFWRQVGRPTRRRGFVAGRELREGCMIATIGGGLCQLSNALYEAALDAGLEVVERHQHTRVVPGSRAAKGRDATVFWNYLDLRLLSDTPFRIDARLTADDLELTIRGYPVVRAEAEPDFFAGVSAHDCLSCGQVTCHRHDPDTAAASTPIPWLVDAPSAEFIAYTQAQAGTDDPLFLPTRRFGATRAWPQRQDEITADAATLRRSAMLRLARGPRAAVLLAADARLAAAYARRLTPEHDRLVIAQSLLPHLWRLGTLQGRRFDVLCDRLPMAMLHATLDAALARHPGSTTLGDFRADAAIVAAESKALDAAERLITAHRAVGECFDGARVTLLDWAVPRPLPARHGGNAVLFAGPAVARKGAHAMREAIQGLDMTLLVARTAEEVPGFWRGSPVRVLAPDEQPDALAGVVLPAIVEHRPTLALRALAAGLPIIATAACGLPPQPGLTLIEADDSAALRAALISMLAEIPSDTWISPKS